jgi:hypothetical protein
VSSEVPWKRILAEAAAVVASILLAFGIDAGWDASRERAIDRSVVDALRTEMVGNRERLIRTIEFNVGARSAVTEFFSLSPDEVLSLEPASYQSPIHVSLWAPYTFDPELGATTVFLDREVADSDAIRLLRQAVIDWHRRILDAGEESDVLWGLSGDVLRLMTSHLADLRPAEGTQVGLNVIRQDYAARLARIRADQELVAAVFAKFNVQGIYTNELRRLLEQTDSVLSRLDHVGS